MYSESVVVNRWGYQAPGQTDAAIVFHVMLSRISQIQILQHYVRHTICGSSVLSRLLQFLVSRKQY